MFPLPFLLQQDKSKAHRDHIEKKSREHADKERAGKDKNRDEERVHKKGGYNNLEFFFLAR